MDKPDYWNLPAEKLYEELGSHPEGLTHSEAVRRLKQYGPNSLKPPGREKGIFLFFSQFNSPLIWLLIGAAALSFLLRDRPDAIIICLIIFLSGLLGYFQERGALKAVEKLLQLVENKSQVMRDGKEEEIPLEKIVPGDVIVLNAGDLIPADCVLLESKLLFINESVLTGESLPVEKQVGPSEKGEGLKQPNGLFLGTQVANGLAKALVIATGKSTEYGKIAEKLRSHPPETAFEAGIRKFGFFLLIVTLILVSLIFLFNLYLHRPILESFLFSLALAVGLTPQLLPAIVSVNLSHGARRMAKKKVIVKRLPAIENFGQMDILCADKTGTVTLGQIILDSTAGADGNPNEKTAFFGFLNAKFQSGYANPLDGAILKKLQLDPSGWNKQDEIPYDFSRKRLSVIFENEGKQVLISKGSVPQMLPICSQVEWSDGTIGPMDEVRGQIEQFFEQKSREGFRSLGVAYGEGEQEENLVFLGFFYFLDPIKPDIGKTVAELKTRGVQLKIITGDHHAVAAHAAQAIGMPDTDLITGAELENLDEAGLLQAAREKNIFAEIVPAEKEKIIQALRKAGHVVGFLGDGVNDVLALHSADVGIAVDSGAAAAKEAADIVLLEKNLNVLREGVEEGRKTFANTLKYVYMATSANFGNMFSMAGASLFLNFLPLLPKQVLLTNFLTDFPEMAIASDRVDLETIANPVRWDFSFIRRFMIVFGLISSVFDYLTFGVLLFLLKSDEALFQTGWFVESVASAALIVLIIRTKRSIFRSKPSKLLTFSVLATILGTLFIPLTPIGALFKFVPLPYFFYLTLAGILFFYAASVEIAKHFFFKKTEKTVVTHFELHRDRE